MVNKFWLLLVLTLLTVPVSAANNTKKEGSNNGVDDAFIRSLTAAEKKGIEKHGAFARQLQEREIEIAKQALNPETSIVPGLKEAIGNSNMVVGDNNVPVRVSKNVKFRVFVSQSMPAKELKAIADISRDRQDLVLVFRGYKPGQTPLQFMQFVRELTGKIDSRTKKLPRIELDPPSFTKLGIIKAPTLALFRDDKALAYVAGTSSVDYLTRQVKAGNTGNLRDAGPVAPIIEVDLISVMKASFAKVDWAAQKRQAMAKVWTALPRFSLPIAERFSRVSYDPSFVVTQAITAPNGAQLAIPGQRINPLDALPFKQHIIIFNAADPLQIRTARALRLQAGKARVTLIATQLPVATLDEYKKLEISLGGRVTLISQQFIDQFRITQIPVRMRAENRRMVLESFRPGTAPPGPGAIVRPRTN